MRKYAVVILPYAMFAIEVVGDTVVATADVAKWMVGRKTLEVVQWVKTKGGTIIRIYPLKGIDKEN